MIAIKTSLKSKFIFVMLLFGDIVFFLAALVITKFALSGVSEEFIGPQSIIPPLAVLFFFFMMYDLYSAQIDSVFNILIATILSVAASTVVSIILVLVFRKENIPVLIWVVRFVILEAVMVTWRVFAASRIKKSGRQLRILIIESMDNTSRLARKLKYASNYGRESTYYIINPNSKEEIDIILNEKLEGFDQVFVSPAIPYDIKNQIETKAFILRKDVSFLAGLAGITTMRGDIVQLDDTPVIQKHPLVITKWQKLIKRAFDIVVSLILVVITLPVFVLCAIAIKLDSKGPVFYKQERYTIGKKRFNVLKFRTMVEDAEKFGAQLATEDDPRITKVGKVLRAMRLDELPQLYNILLGSMSVVGPRPERPIFADEFSQKVKNYDMRYYVKAGLTGYAQVYGKYNTRVSDKILMDLIYISRYSFLLDIKLILLTVKTMFVKSATEGIDEERDRELCSIERERKRRQETLKLLGLRGTENEDIDNNTGVQL
ncbi:MAG: sugar transferase [Clostridia bacterium]|nr:sugar transferase [Clostridia bacterium]